MTTTNATCFCTGPQNGQPLCPCEMRNKNIVQENGRWIERRDTVDHGPVVEHVDMKQLLTESNK